MEHVRIFEFLSLFRDQPFSYLMKLPFTFQPRVAKRVVSVWLWLWSSEIRLPPVRIKPRSGLHQVVLSPFNRLSCLVVLGQMEMPSPEVWLKMAIFLNCQFILKLHIKQAQLCLFLSKLTKITDESKTNNCFCQRNDGVIYEAQTSHRWKLGIPFKQEFHSDFFFVSNKEAM